MMLKHSQGLLFFSLLMAAGVLVAVTAKAQESCSTSCGRYESGQCVEDVKTCTTIPVPGPSYGAIAYGRTSKAWGYSHNWGSQAKAESVATQNCAQHGDDCEVMVWFDRRCGAVAAGGGTAAFWGLGNSDGQAQADARNKCLKGGGKACEVKISQCSM
jgi:Domain of unknown function (DUF4189)